MMRLQPTTFGVAVIAAAVGSARSSGTSRKLTDQSARGGHSDARRSEGPVEAMHQLNNLNWRPAPATFPPGAMFAVVQGNPCVAGEVFTVRLRFPDGYILPPHTHPTDEHVTVLRGTFGVGLGEVFSAESLTLLQTGDFIIASKNMAHFASARGATEVQVHAIGPFRMTYVNVADDPTRK